MENQFPFVNPPVPPQPIKKSKLPLILLLLFIIMSPALGVYIYFQQRKTINIMKPESNWLLYVNNVSGYTVQYPPDWNALDDPTIASSILSNDENKITIAQSDSTPSDFSLYRTKLKIGERNVPCMLSVDKTQAQCYMASKNLLFTLIDKSSDGYVAGILASFISIEKPVSVTKAFSPSDKVMGNYFYPPELLTLTDSSLTSFNCNPIYDNQFDGTFAYTVKDSPTEQRVRLSDPSILKYLLDQEKNIKNVSRSSLFDAQICHLDGGKTLLLYGIFTGNTQGGTTTYLGYFNNLKEPITTIPVESTPYFACHKLLAVTKDSQAYVECWGGDESGSKTSIYKVNLTNKISSTLIYHCDDQVKGGVSIGAICNNTASN